MTAKFSTLILAATIPQEETLRQLLLCFDTVFLYTPIEESDPTPPGELGDLLQTYAPAPVGENLHNFQQLIRDMTSNRAEYYGGGLSRMSAGNAVDEESVWRLISRLTPRAASQSRDEETLVQARLLLKLAEVRDREEREIEETLAQVDGLSLAMLHGLTDGEDSEEEGLRALLDHDRRQAEGDTLGQRLWAWSQLFLRDPRLAEHWLPTTTPEVMAILADLTTTGLADSPTRLLSLPLPGVALMDRTPAEYLQEREAWRTAIAACRATLVASLKGAAISGSSEVSEAIQGQWATHLDGMQSWTGTTRAALDFYLLPVSLPTLLAQIAKRPPPPDGGQSLPHGLVAVLRPIIAE